MRPLPRTCLALLGWAACGLALTACRPARAEGEEDAVKFIIRPTDGTQRTVTEARPGDLIEYLVHSQLLCHGCGQTVSTVRIPPGTVFDPKASHIFASGGFEQIGDQVIIRSTELLGFSYGFAVRVKPANEIRGLREIRWSAHALGTATDGRQFNGDGTDTLPLVGVPNLVDLQIQPQREESFPAQPADEVEPDKTVRYVVDLRTDPTVQRLTLTATLPATVAERALRITGGGRLRGNVIRWNLAKSVRRVEFTLKLRDADKVPADLHEVLVELAAEARDRGGAVQNVQARNTLKLLCGTTVQFASILGRKVEMARFFNAQPVAAEDWSMLVQVTEDDGLTLHNVTLGGRLLARAISLPYLDLETTALPITRCELGPLGGAVSPRSRLIGFSIVDSRQLGKLGIVALYALDRIPEGSPTCLLVRQLFEFESARMQQCQPFGRPVRCARFAPFTDYEFHPAGGETLRKVLMPQRFHIEVDGAAANSAALFKENDVAPVFTARNPVPTETFETAILRGAPGFWDSYQQSPLELLSEPNPALDRRGAPEALHIHWRWGAFHGPAFNDGQPIVPPGSDQTVELGVSRATPGEEDPFNFMDTINGEAVDRGPIVLWYVASGFKSADRFFLHGGFFEPFGGP